MNDEYSAANDRYVIHDTNYAKPSTRYVSDPKGNVFKISDLSRKQIEGASSSVLNPKGEVATSTSEVKPSTDVISQIEGVSQKETPSEIIDMIDKN